MKMKKKEEGNNEICGRYSVKSAIFWTVFYFLPFSFFIVRIIPLFYAQPTHQYLLFASMI